ncbi:DUF7500 family protein [Natronolimnobius baerhuensis]|uniref:Flagella cluster protein n=1 Tax=Natronolimnobius baerhuensis TaxID=253108 RepID=A0A202E9U9_9EURY|nr:hypothetical protein [Natronolimnobius baerhuensis]OVE84994.1 hypothetical protein B2G88_11605 [Natronolimnobius baerhuensis]
MTQNNEDEDPKANADVPPVLPNEQQPSSTSRSRGALSPDDLDFTDSPYVDEIDDGRYVVSADRRPSSGSPAQQTRSAASGHQESNANATAGETAAESAATPRARDSTETAEQTPEEPSQSQPAAADSSEELQTPTREPAPSQSPQSVHETQATSQSPEAARSLLASELEHAEARYAIDIISRFDDETARHRTASDDVVGTFNSLLFWYARHVSGQTPTNRAASLLLEKSDFTPALSTQQVEQAMRTHGLEESSSLGELLEALE